MLAEIILVLILGIAFGTLTGLIPGIHINLVGIFLLTLTATALSEIPAIYLAVFITSMAITHTFIDFIPSIFLGCPDGDTELSILPGHELLKSGHGYQAIILTTYGSLAAIIILILIAFPAGILIDKTFNLIKTLTPYLLIIISIILISFEKHKLTALKVFILTGILGYLVLSIPEETLNQPLLPLLSGLFGSSMLLMSIKNKTQIPEQKISKPKSRLLRPLLGSVIASPLCSFLPGLGSGQAAIIGQTISKSKDQKSFLILLGATNTLVMGFSFITLFLLGKTRTGAAVAISELIPNFQINVLILILLIVLISGIISFFLTKHLAKFFSKNINKINYTKLSITTLTILAIIITTVSRLSGLLVFIVATLTGIYCINQKVRRTQMMGCLLIPVILFYLF